MESRAGLLIKRWDVTVFGYGTGAYYAVSRGRALADAWRSAAFYDWTFKRFLREARARAAEPASPRFGEPITVGGKPAFFIESNRQYVRFAYAGSDHVSNAHPYDVEPEEYRPDTYRAAGTRGDS